MIDAITMMMNKKAAYANNGDATIHQLCGNCPINFNANITAVIETTDNFNILQSMKKPIIDRHID